MPLYLDGGRDGVVDCVVDCVEEGMFVVEVVRVVELIERKEVRGRRGGGCREPGGGV